MQRFKENRIGSSLLCAAIGFLFPLPLMAVYETIAGKGLIHISEAYAPLVLFGASCLIGWCSSLFAGLVCRRFTRTYYSLLNVFLANSSGWMSLFFLFILLRVFLEGEHVVRDGGILLLAIIILSGVGFTITWYTMKPPVAPHVVSQSPNTNKSPEEQAHMSSDVFFSLLIAIAAVVGLVLWFLWNKH